MSELKARIAKVKAKHDADNASSKIISDAYASREATDTEAAAAIRKAKRQARNEAMAAYNRAYREELDKRMKLLFKRKFCSKCGKCIKL